MSSASTARDPVIAVTAAAPAAASLTKRRRLSTKSEDDTSSSSRTVLAPPTPPSSRSPRKRTTVPLAPSSPSPASPARLLVKLNGRVYRPPSPDDLRTKREQEAELLLDEPVETVADLETSRREEKRKSVEDQMRTERLKAAEASRRGISGSSSSSRKQEDEEPVADASPQRTAGRLLRFDSDDGIDVTGSPLGQELARPAGGFSSPSRRRAVTPPPTRTTATALSPALGLPFQPTSSPRRRPLPPHLASLVALHSAVERTLILHLSTAGSSIASTVSETTVNAEDGSTTATVRMTNLIDLSTLGRMLESTGKRFTKTELRRLVWVWQGAGGSASSSAINALASPTRRRTESTATTDRTASIVLGRDSEDEVGGMGFLVTRARTASSSTSSNGSSSLFNMSGARVSHTYGIGIAVAVKSNPQLPKLELVSSSSSASSLLSSPGRKAGSAHSASMSVSGTMPPSPSSVGKGRDGMSIVALWTQGKEQRQKEVERRLRAWADKQVKVEPEDEPDVFESTPAVPMVPLAALPLLSPAVPAIPSTSTPSPRKRTSSTSDPFGSPSAAKRAAAAGDNDALPVVSPQKFVETLLAGKPLKSKAGKAADRERALRERIQAKQAAQQKSAYHASLSALSTGESSPTKRSLKRHGPAGAEEELGPEAGEPVVTMHEVRKRNAMLSRLGSVADVVAMRCQGRPILYEEVCTAISNSPLVSIGYDEADSALAFLAEHFPDFCYIKLVGSEPWLSLRGVQRAVEVKELVRQQLARAAAALDATR